MQLRPAFLAFITLLLAPVAWAQDTAMPLPPPIIVPNITPPLTIPSEVVAELQNGRILCERKLAKFDINLNHLSRTDFNGDGAEDFVMSSAGYLCNGSNTEFASLTGDEFFIFSSLPGGKYLRHPETIRAFEMTVDHGFKPPHLLFTVQCPHKFGREFSGHTRLRWNGQQLKSVTRNAGCDGTPPDASVAAAPGEASAAPISSGPRVNRTSLPGREIDITNMDGSTIAAPVLAAETPPEPAPPPADTTVMTPEPPEPDSPPDVTAEATVEDSAEPITEEQPAPIAVQEAAPESPPETMAASPPVTAVVQTPAPAPKAQTVTTPKPTTLPGATFPDLSAPPPGAPIAVIEPVMAAPPSSAALPAEALLDAPVKRAVKPGGGANNSTPRGLNE